MGHLQPQRTTWTPGPRSMIVPTSRDTAVRPDHSQAPGHLLSIKEIASACQLSEKSVRRAIDDGELCAVKLRSRLRVTPEDFEAWIASSRRNSSRAALDRRPLRTRRAPAGPFRALIQDGADSGAMR
ncbi:MAG: helix-turn-helix domain-containing protein [Solirubrobacteraceae bacterium]